MGPVEGLRGGAAVPWGHPVKTWLQVKVRLRVRLLNRRQDGVHPMGDSLLLSQNSSPAPSLVPSQLFHLSGVF